MLFVELANDADALADGRLPVRACLLVITLLSLSLWAGIAALIRAWL